MVTDARRPRRGRRVRARLFGLQRLSVREISSALRRASDVPALVAVRGRHPRAVACAGRAGRRQRAADADDLEPQRPVDGARASNSPRAPFDLSGIAHVLARHGFGGPRRTDDRHRPGQRHHVRGQRCGASDAAIRERLLPFARDGQRDARPLRLPAVQGRRDGDESAMVPVAAEWRPRSRNGSTAAIRDSLLAATIFFDFRSLWGARRAGRRCCATTSPHARRPTRAS